MLAIITKANDDFWDGFLEEDIEKLERTKIHITIYNGYVE